MGLGKEQLPGELKKILESSELKSSELNNYWKTNMAGRLLNIEQPEGSILFEHPK